MSYKLLRRIAAALAAASLTLLYACGESPANVALKQSALPEAEPRIERAVSEVANYPDDLQWPMWGRSSRHDFRSSLNSPEKLNDLWHSTPQSGNYIFSPVIDNIGTMYSAVDNPIENKVTVVKVNSFTGDVYELWELSGRRLVAAPLLGKDHRLYLLTSSSATGSGVLKIHAVNVRNVNEGSEASWSPVEIATSGEVTCPFPLAAPDGSYYFAYTDGSPLAQRIRRLAYSDHTLYDVYTSGSFSDHNREIISLALNPSKWGITGGELYALTAKETTGANRRLIAFNPLAHNDIEYEAAVIPPLDNQSNYTGAAAPLSNLMISSLGTVFEVDMMWRAYTSILDPKPAPPLSNNAWVDPDWSASDHNINFLNEYPNNLDEHYSLLRAKALGTITDPLNWAIIYNQFKAPDPPEPPEPPEPPGPPQWLGGFYLPEPRYNSSGLFGLQSEEDEDYHAGMVSLRPINQAPLIVVTWGNGSAAPDDAAYVIDVSQKEPRGVNSTLFTSPISTHFNAQPIVGQLTQIVPSPKVETYIYATGQGSTGAEIVALGKELLSQPGPQSSLLLDPSSGPAPLAVSFDASGSFDPYSIIEEYEWDWNADGTYDSPAPNSPTANHTYGKPGIHTARVRVTNAEGLTDTAEVVITVGLPLTAGGSTWNRSFGNNGNTLSAMVSGPASTPDLLRTVDVVSSGTEDYLLGAYASGPLPALAYAGIPFTNDGVSYHFFGDSAQALHAGGLDESANTATWIGSNLIGDLDAHPAEAVLTPALCPNGSMCYVANVWDGGSAPVPEIHVYLSNGELDPGWDPDLDGIGPFSHGPLVSTQGDVVAAHSNGKLSAWEADGTLRWTRQIGSTIVDYCMASDGDVYVLAHQYTVNPVPFLVRVDMELGLQHDMTYVIDLVGPPNVPATSLGLLEFGGGGADRLYVVLQDSKPELWCFDGELTQIGSPVELEANSTRPALRGYLDGDDLYAQIFVASAGSPNELIKYQHDVNSSDAPAEQWRQTVLSGLMLASHPTLDTQSNRVYIHGGSKIECYTHMDAGTMSFGFMAWSYTLPAGNLTGEVISLSPLGTLWIAGECPDPDPPAYPLGLPCYFELGL